MPELLPYAPGSPEWLAARRQGVTATDIVTILGLSSWSSAYSLYWQKMGQVPETPDNDRFRLGRELESYVKRRWSEATPICALLQSGLYRHSDRAWQMATPDGLTYTTDEYLWANGVLECKTWADADRPAWGGQVARYTGRIDDDGTHLDPEPVQPPAGNQIPPAVRAQVLWQMDVMGVTTGHVGVVFLPSGEFRSYTIGHNGNCNDTDALELDDSKPLCPVCDDQELMRLEGERFMRRLRLELPAPDPDSSAATLAAVRARFTRQPDKQAEVSREIFGAWHAAKEKVDIWTSRARECESNLREQAGEASVLTVDGQPVARRIVTDAPVRAHTRHSDYLKRIKTEADNDA